MMKRRGFLSLLGAVGIAPVLPLPWPAAPVAAGYNRYIYGLAVFQTRIRASFSAADLMTRLRITSPVAKSMIREMTADGAIAPAMSATGGALRTFNPYRKTAGAWRKVVHAASDLACQTENEETAAPGPRADEQGIVAARPEHGQES